MSTLQSKRWSIAVPVTDRELARLPGIPPLLVQLLWNRRVHDPSAAQEFLTGRGPGHSFARLEGINSALARLRRAIKGGEPIAVFGDFDVDGVTATVLLVHVLSALGADVKPYIPDRVDEGYGLNLPALRQLYRQGVRVVVTVDCGIRSVAEVKQASRALDLIITDHHNPGPDLPPAVAVINPKLPGCSYPFKGLSGVGIAFKLAQALLRVQRQMSGEAALAEESLLDLVALGTVADLAPLLGENRLLVRGGLERLNTTSRPGIEALMADAGLRRGDVDATAIGFRLGPRLNAAGRLDTAMLAYRLLTNSDPLETRDLARRLGELNSLRQQLTEQTVAAAVAQVLADQPDARLFVVSSREFKPGIVGLAASRVVEAFYRPCVAVELGDQISRGSCRSIPEFDITAALDQCADLLLRHGGHRAAAGFTLATENLPLLRRRLQAIAAESLGAEELRPALEIDAQLPLEEANWATRGLLAQMEPCGAGNPQPVLLSREVEVRDVRVMGNEQQHLKLILRDGRGISWDAVFYRQGSLAGRVPGRVDVAYTLDVHEWNGEKRLQINVQDLRTIEDRAKDA